MLQLPASPELNPDPEIVTVSPPLMVLGERVMTGEVTVKVVVVGPG
jgi:hypothetical protein